MSWILNRQEDIENIIKLNINKTAKREKEVFTSIYCGYPFQLLISIFVVTLYNDLAAREGQLGTALTVLSLDWSGVE